MTSFATRVHKLTNADLADCPAWSKVADEVSATLSDAWICAHNASVEYRVLRRHLPTWTPAGVIDTLRLTRAAYPEAPRHNLDNLIDHLDLDLTNAPRQRHRAAFDAYAAAQLLLAAADRYSSWEDLATHASLSGMTSAQEKSAVADTLF